jgi:hypothetical protein
MLPIPVPPPLSTVNSLTWPEVLRNLFATVPLLFPENVVAAGDVEDLLHHEYWSLPTEKKVAILHALCMAVCRTTTIHNHVKQTCQEREDVIKQFNKEEQEYKTSFKKRQKLRRQADIAKAKAEKAAQQVKAANADTADQNVTSPPVDENDPIALEKAEKERKAKEEKEKLEKEEAAVLAGRNDGHNTFWGWILSPTLNIRLLSLLLCCLLLSFDRSG